MGIGGAITLSVVIAGSTLSLVLALSPLKSILVELREIRNELKRSR